MMNVEVSDVKAQERANKTNHAYFFASTVLGVRSITSNLFYSFY